MNPENIKYRPEIAKLNFEMEEVEMFTFFALKIVFSINFYEDLIKII